MTQEKLWSLSAVELSRLTACRHVSVHEVAESVISRINECNSYTNSLVEHDPRAIMTRALELDRRLAAGHDPGPLTGVPISIKINIDQLGYATSSGAQMYRFAYPPSNHSVVDQLHEAGALFIGRTNASTFGYRWFTENRLHGRTTNPHNPDTTAGGSSGGAAAAIASGIGAVAIGTDVAGSIRYPAYACGVQGLRPSFGRVSTYNPSNSERWPVGAQLMAVVGPIARTVADLRLAFHAMVGADHRDPWLVPCQPSDTGVPLRAAFCIRPDGLDTQAEVAEAVYEAADRLRDAGWNVVELEQIPPLLPGLDVQLSLWIGDDYDGQVRRAQEEGDVGALTVLNYFKNSTKLLTTESIPQAFRMRTSMARAWQTFTTTEYPIVILPSSAELPFQENLDLKDEETFWRVWKKQMPMLSVPVTGLPSVNVRTKLLITESGRFIPVGVQVVGPRFREDICLLAAEAIEARGVPIAALSFE